MRILSLLAFSPPSPLYGGAERQMHALHKGLRAHGVEVHVLADRRQVGREFQEIEGVPVWGAPFPVLTTHPLRPGNIKLWRDWQTIRRLVLERIPRPDLIQVTTFRQPALVGYWLSRLLGVPWVVRLACSGSHGDLTFSHGNWLSRWYLPRMAKSVNRVIALDEQTRVEALAHGILPQRLQVIPNGLVFQRFSLPTANTFSEQALSVLFVGRLAHQKRIDTLLEAFSLLQNRSAMTMALRIVGGGEQDANLRQHADQLGITDRCSFTGPVTCPENELVRGDCFVNPSESEGLPNAVLEAAAFGLPLILSDIPIHREIATAVGMSDYLFPVADASALAESIMKFNRLTTEQKAQLSAKCAAYGKGFTPENRDQAYLNLYRQLLREASGAC